MTNNKQFGGLGIDYTVLGIIYRIVNFQIMNSRQRAAEYQDVRIH